MSLPYPSDREGHSLQMPDPDNPRPYHGQPQQPPVPDNLPSYQYQGYPPHQQQYPAQTPGYPPQTPGYPPQTPGYPPQTPGYPPEPQGYNAQSHGYPPYPQHPPATPGYLPHSHPSAPGCPSQPHPSAPGYPQHPPAAPGYPPQLQQPPLGTSRMPGNDIGEQMAEVSLNEGLHQKSGQLLGLGKQLGKKLLSEMINNFREEISNNLKAKQRHSYFVPKQEEKDEAAYVPSDIRDLQKHYPKNVNTMKIKNFHRSQDYKTIAKSLQNSGRLFEDDKFPADNRQLSDNVGGNNYIVHYFGRREVRPSEIQWLRPHEIVQNPEMYAGERDRFDINQGEIGDCWFLAALANLAEDDDAFQRVVPRSQGFGRGQYTGMFRFRFFRFGEWVEVVVDDRLPTRNGKLIYLKAKERNEFWSPLLEKAYAKLYGSYKALEGGLTIESAVDFTGGIPEMIDIANLSMDKETLFYEMRKAYKNKAFMSCSLSNSRYQREATNLGLQARHAYTITKVVEVRSGRGTIPLIRMRNPHGNAREWKGAWGDNDEEWRKISSDQKRRLGLTFDNDGEFYMNFNRDFLRYFGEVEIVHKTPGAMVRDQQSDLRYEVMYFPGEWRGDTAGGCGNDSIANFVRNPQFVFSLTDPDLSDDKTRAALVLSLAQRVAERKTEHAIGFRVYRLEPGVSQVDARFASRNQPVGKTDQYVNLREVSLRLVLPPGQYAVIPTTFRRGEEGQFLVRLFTERHWGDSDQAAKHTFREGEGINKSPSPGPGHARHAVHGGFHHNGRSYINIPIQRMAANDDEVDNEHAKKGKLGKLEDKIKKGYKIGKDFYAKLKEFYNFPKDRNEEISILRETLKAL